MSYFCTTRRRYYKKFSSVVAAMLRFGIIAFLCLPSSAILVETGDDNTERRLQILEQDNALLRQQYASQGMKLNDMEKKIETLEKKDQSVAFFAYLTNDLVNPPDGATVVFDDAVTNVGSSYDSSHGVFRAPVNGTYHFAMLASSPIQSAVHELHLHIMHNRMPVSYLYLDAGVTNEKDWKQASATAVVYLNANDHVWVETSSVIGQPTLEGHHGGDMHSHFSGFLISAD